MPRVQTQICTLCSPFPLEGQNSIPPGFWGATQPLFWKGWLFVAQVSPTTPCLPHWHQVWLNSLFMPSEWFVGALEGLASRFVVFQNGRSRPCLPSLGLKALPRGSNTAPAGARVWSSAQGVASCQGLTSSQLLQLASLGRLHSLCVPQCPRL